jgi:hypothetical protein
VLAIVVPAVAVTCHDRANGIAVSMAIIAALCYGHNCLGHVRPYRARTSPDEASEPAVELRLSDIANGVTWHHLLSVRTASAV